MTSHKQPYQCWAVIRNRDRHPEVLRAVLKRLITVELKSPRTLFWYVTMTIPKKLNLFFCYIGARVTIRAASDITLGYALGSRVEIPNTQEGFTLHLISALLALMGTN
jgi:hypothetical protein